MLALLVKVNDDDLGENTKMDLTKEKVNIFIIKKKKPYQQGLV